MAIVADKENERQKDEDADASPSGFPLKPSGQVTLKHLNEPPPSGKKTIHPRRSAPLVPTREQRTEELPSEDSDSHEPSSE